MVIEREKRQLRFYCYPPRVAGSQFERASRGLCEHSEQGQEGEIDRLGHLARQRIVTQSELELNKFRLLVSDPWNSAANERGSRSSDGPGGEQEQTES